MLKEYEEIYGKDDSIVDISNRFSYLLKQAHKQTKMQAVILVDEYDKPLLYQAGYLTIKDYDERFRSYNLQFPNEEVKYGFFNNLLAIKTKIDSGTSSFYVEKFVKDIRDANYRCFYDKNAINSCFYSLQFFWR